RSNKPSMQTPRMRTPGRRIGQESGVAGRPSRRWRRKAARMTGRFAPPKAATSPRAVRATTSASASCRMTGSKVATRSSSGMVSACARLLRLIKQCRHTFGDRVDAEYAGQLQHLHDLRNGGAVAQCIADMRAQAWQIEMRGCCVDRDVDQFANLRRQRAVLP